MNCDVICFIALDEILGLLFGGVVGVALEFHVGNQFLYDSAGDPACFRIPGDVIASFERLGHLFRPSLPSLPCRRSIRPSNGQEKGAINRTFNVMRDSAFKREHLASRKVHGPFGGIEPDFSIQGLD